MSGNGSYAKSMNGIVSFDDGNGTTIEGNEINTDIINCNTLNAQTDVNTSTIYTNFINSGTVGYVQCLTDVVFNAEVEASFVPTSNNQLCNKLYVDTVATSGSTILSSTNVFTGASNTFNNYLITSNIVSTGSAVLGSDKIFNKLTTSNIVDMFSDPTNTFNGSINICCGNGVQNPTMNIMVGNIGTFYGIKPVNIGDVYTSIKLCNSMRITLDAITAVDDTTSKDIFKFNTGVITIGKTGKLQLGNDISITQKTIESTGTTDTINLFNNISGTIGQINMAGKFVIKELSIATTSITDNVKLFNNLSGAFGAVNMVTNLLFKQSNILSTAVGDVINLFTNLTTGTLNIATGITTGTLNIATGVMTGILNIGTGMTTGRVNIGSALTTGDIFIGNTTGTTTGALGDISMGNDTNNSSSAGNGTVRIYKLRIGNSPVLRNIRYGSVAGGSSNSSFNFAPAFPSGQVPFIVGTIQSNANNRAYSIAFTGVTNTSCTYHKYYIASTGGFNAAVSESFHYYAWSD